MFEFMNYNDSLSADAPNKQVSTGEWHLTSENIFNQPLPIENSIDFTLISHGNEQIFQHPDPLIYADKFQMETLNIHVVKPHYVQGYVRTDGTVVDGYLRDGDGHGYLRTSPDGILENNLGFTKNKG